MDPVKINLVQTSTIAAVGERLLLAFMFVSLVYLVWVLISWNKKPDYEPSTKGFVAISAVFALILGTAMYGWFIDYKAQEEAVVQTLSQVAEISGVKFVNTSYITYANLAFPDQETPINFTKDQKFNSGTILSTKDGIVLVPKGSEKSSPDDKRDDVSSDESVKERNEANLAASRYSRSQPAEILVKDGFIWVLPSSGTGVKDITTAIMTLPPSNAQLRYSNGEPASDVKESLERFTTNSELSKRVDWTERDKS